MDIYDSTIDPVAHVDSCVKWKLEEFTPHLWVHRFIHSLGTIPKT